MAGEKCGPFGGSTHCTCQLTSLIYVCLWVGCRIQLTMAV